MKNDLKAFDTSLVSSELDAEQLDQITGGGGISDGALGWAVGKLLDAAVDAVDYFVENAPKQWAKGSPYNESGLVN